MPGSKPASTGDDGGRDIEHLRRLADLLDTKWTIPGTGVRIGLDPLIGLVPGIGDATSLGLSGYLVYRAHRLGVPKRTKLRMLWNLALDALLGSIPLVGDLFDLVFRANRRNLALLERHLARVGAVHRAGTVKEVSTTDRPAPPSSM